MWQQGDLTRLSAAFNYLRRNELSPPFGLAPAQQFFA